MPQVMLARPFEKLELPDEYRLQPDAFGHLRLRQTLTPSAALGFRKIGKWTLVDLKALELLEHRRALASRLASPSRGPTLETSARRPSADRSPDPRPRSKHGVRKSVVGSAADSR